MISFLKQYLGGPQVTPNNTNLLDKIIWGQFTNDVIAWYDGKQQEFIKEGYQKNAMVYAIIRKIADKAKAAQLQTFKPTKERARSKYRSLKYSGKDLLFHHSKVVKTKEMTLIEGADPLTDLLRKPNKNQTTSEFIDEFITWYSTTGEAFLYGVGPGSESRNAGKYQELYWLPTHLVEIKMNPVGLSFSDELILGYKLSIGDQYIIIPKEDVLHIKSTNLEWDLNGAQLRGQSPLLAGRNFLKKNNLGVEAGAKSNKNMGARGIVSPNINNVEMYQDAERTEQFRQRIDERVNGTDNRDKVIASGVPMQYTQMGLSSQAMQLIEALNYDDEKLCGLWGVNPVIFRPNATDANLEHAQKSLVTDVILPILNLFENKLEEWLNPKFKTNYIIEFDVSSFSEMQPDVKMIMDSYGDNSKISINELRVMLGWDEIESNAANTLWIPSSRIPIEDAFTGSGADFSDFQNTTE